jgi:regulator of sigma E protease
MRQTASRGIWRARPSPRCAERRHGEGAAEHARWSPQRGGPAGRGGHCCHTDSVTWILTLLGIMALIVLHELGHFLVAKAVGMRVERFSLFFPPRLAGVKRGETDYSIGAIPAGGYVKITGMSPIELQQLDLRVADRAYYMQAPWKRIAVILAGPGVNILIAFLLFWVVLVSGDLHGSIALENLDPGVRSVVAQPAVATVEPGQAADGVLRRGDRILTVDGRPAGVESTRARVEAHSCKGAPVAGCRAATPVRLTVRRNGHTVALSVYPRYEAKAKRMLIGFAFAAGARHFSVAGAASAAIGAMWHTTTGTISGFGKALSSSKERKQLHSLIGITEVGDETVAAGAGYAVVFLGFLSLVLAVINLFPFLPLDGGHVLWSLLEKLRGRRVSLNAMYRYSSVGIVLLLFLVVNGVGNDISRLTG